MHGFYVMWRWVSWYRHSKGSRSSCENDVAKSISVASQMILRHDPWVPRILNLHLLHNQMISCLWTPIIKRFRVYKLSSGKTSFLEFVICTAGSTTNSGNLAPASMRTVFQHTTTIWTTRTGNSALYCNLRLILESPGQQITEAHYRRNILWQWHAKTK